MTDSTLTYAASQYGIFAKQVLAQAEPVESRQGLTYEMLCVRLLIEDALISDPTRKFNLGFALAEFRSIVTGEDNIELFTKWIAGYSKYSDGNGRLANSYGSRNVETGKLNRSAIGRCIDVLRANPQARNSVFSIHRNSDIGTEFAHEPCTLSIQWLIRKGSLIQIVTMRSNDIWWGLSTDALVFTLLHQMVATELGVPRGPYWHQAASLHAYEWALPAIKQMQDRTRPIHFMRNSTLSMSDVDNCAGLMSDLSKAALCAYGDNAELNRWVDLRWP